MGYSFLGNKANADAPPAPAADAKHAEESKKTFLGGDQGFVDLKLREVKDYNHNTKRFVFELPEPEAISGLSVTCESNGEMSLQTLTFLAAIITKYKAPDDEKPTIRPYTPINAESTSPPDVFCLNH